MAGHHVHSTDELFNLIYSEDYTNARLASFSSYLQQSGRNGDAVAQKIMQKAADELVLLAATTLKNAGYANNEHTLFLNGGILKNNPGLVELITAQLHKTHPNITLKLCEEKPIEAIFNRGLRELNGAQSVK